MHTRMRRHPLQHSSGVRSRDKKIHIPDSLFPPSQATRSRNNLQPAQLFDVAHHFARGIVGEVEMESAAVLAHLSDSPQNLLLQLRAHARQCPQFLILAELLQLVDRLNLEILKQQCNTSSGPSPWIFRKSKAAGGNFCSSSSRRSQLPRFAISPNTAARPLPMPGTSVIFASQGSPEYRQYAVPDTLQSSTRRLR